MHTKLPGHNDTQCNMQYYTVKDSHMKHSFTQRKTNDNETKQKINDKNTEM